MADIISKKVKELETEADLAMKPHEIRGSTGQVQKIETNPIKALSLYKTVKEIYRQRNAEDAAKRVSIKIGNAYLTLYNTLERERRKSGKPISAEADRLLRYLNNASQAYEDAQYVTGLAVCDAGFEFLKGKVEGKGSIATITSALKSWFGKPDTDQDQKR